MHQNFQQKEKAGFIFKLTEDGFENALLNYWEIKDAITREKFLKE
jgi:hypothetical protein